jgi:hypothetical protein
MLWSQLTQFPINLFHLTINWARSLRWRFNFFRWLLFCLNKTVSLTNSSRHDWTFIYRWVPSYCLLVIVNYKVLLELIWTCLCTSYWNFWWYRYISNILLHIRFYELVFIWFYVLIYRNSATGNLLLLLWFETTFLVLDWLFYLLFLIYSFSW